MNRTYRVRLGLVAVVSLLAVLVLIQPGRSQPGFPGGGIRGGAPTPPVPTMPGPTIPGPTMPGRPGGISGTIGQPPTFPQPQFPPIPQPQFPQPGIGGGGIGGPTIYTWSCGRCGRVLGTGMVPPGTAYCGICGVNNIIPATAGGGAPALAGQPGPIMTPAAGPVFTPAPVVQGGSDSSRSSTTMFGLSRLTLIVVTLGVLLLLGVGIGGVAIAFVKNQPKKPRRRPRRRLDDDY
jgi:hypothetical protein